MKTLLLLLISFIMLVQSLYSQNEPSNEFNFWLGEWDLTWTGNDGKVQKGENIIRTILNGKVIEENFKSFGNGFAGRSYSVFDSSSGLWKQTWVDNNGGYLDFTGNRFGDKMILRRKGIREGKEFLQRMVWYNISEDSLDWNWELSSDNGETWLSKWKIHYTRRSSD